MPKEPEMTYRRSVPRRHLRFLAALLLGVEASVAGQTGGTAPFQTGPKVTWRGGTGDPHWSNPANWDARRVPGPFDIALFDALSPDALLGPESTGVVGGVRFERDFPGTLRLARDLTIHGDLFIGGGKLLGGDEPLWVEGVASVGGGLLETPRNVMRVRRLDIRGPGIVRVGGNGRLELIGDGTPLTGDGRLDTTTNRPTSVEYTGQATSDITLAEPAAGYQNLGIGGHERDGELRRQTAGGKSVRGRREPLAFGDPETDLTLYSGEKELVSAVIDPVGGFAYCGTQTYPGIIVKVRLSDFTRVGALTLNAGEDSLQSAVIDPIGGFAYFGTSTSPGIVVKVRLSDFTRVGALTLDPGENYLFSAVIDTAEGFAYFGTDTAPTIIVKVRLSDFTRDAALTLNAGEDFAQPAVIDPAAGFAYFGTGLTSPAVVVKVRLSDLTRVGALTLNPGESSLDSAVIDPAGGFAYFGTWTTPGIVVKVRLSDFTRVGALTLNAAEKRLSAAVIDPSGGFAYFGTDTDPTTVVKVRLSDFTRVGALTLNAGEGLPLSAVIDPAGGFAYFGTFENPGIIVKVRLSDFTRVGALTLKPGENDLSSAVIDPAGGFAYFGTFSDTGIIIKVRLSDFTRVGALTLNPSEINLLSAAIDTAGGFAYFGTYTDPGIVVKVRLSDFTRVGALVLNPGEIYLRSAVIDPAGGFAYFGTSAFNPGMVVKVRLSDFTRIGALTLDEFNVDSAVIDPAAGFAYFGTMPGTVFKVRLSDFSRVDALTLNPGESSLNSAVIDPAGGFAYFGTFTNPASVVKVRLSDFTRVDALTLNPAEYNLCSAVIDPAAGFAYFGTFGQPGIVVKVRLSDMTRMGALTVSSAGTLGSAVIDAAAKFAYFGAGTWPGIVVRVDISEVPTATATVSGGGTICPGGSTAIFAALTGKSPWSLTWSDGVVQSGLETSPAARSVSPTATTVYTVTAVSDAIGPGTASGSAMATVIAPIPVITTPGTVGAGSPNRTASVPSHAGSMYAWTIGNGTITSGQGTSQITFTAGAAGTPLTLSVLETSLLGCPSAPGNATVTVVPSGSSILFYTVTPCRQLDTRSGAGTPIASGETLTVPLAGAPCGIPSGATSVSVNLTVTEQTAQGFLTIYPADQGQPLVSNINFKVGPSRANNAILSLSSDGTGNVNVYNGSGGTVHVILDVNGFFQ